MRLKLFHHHEDVTIATVIGKAKVIYATAVVERGDVESTVAANLVTGASAAKCFNRIVAALSDTCQRPLPIRHGRLPQCDRRAKRSADQSAGSDESPDAADDGECPVG